MQGLESDDIKVLEMDVTSEDSVKVLPAVSNYSWDSEPLFLRCLSVSI